MKCEEFKKQLDESSESGLTQELQERMKAHSEACPACRREHQDQLRVVRALGDFYQGFDPVPGKPFRFSFPSEDAAPAWWKSLIAWFRYSRTSLAFAGIVLFVLLLDVLYPRLYSVFHRGQDNVWRLTGGSLVALVGRDVSGPNAPLPNGALLTARDEVQLSFLSRAAVRVLPGTVVTPRSDGLQIVGKAAFQVTPGSSVFRVETPSLNIAVTGTGFQVWSSARATVVELQSGRLTLDNPAGSVPLEAGTVGMALLRKEIRIATGPRMILGIPPAELERLCAEPSLLPTALPPSPASSSRNIEPAPERCPKVIVSSGVVPSRSASSTIAAPETTRPEATPDGPPAGQNPLEVLGQ